MGAHRLKRDDAQITEAWRSAGSLRQFCVALGMSFNVDSARRLCQQAGLEYPAPHWGAQPGVMPGETAAQRLERELREDKLARKVREVDELYKRAKDELADQREFLAAVLDAAASPVPPPDFRPRERQSRHLPAREMVLHLSDWHAGERISLVDTGFNVYDWDVLQWCIKRYVEAVVESARNVMRAYRIPRATIAISGDMIAGHNVYEQQGFQLCKDAGAQVVEFSALVAAMLREIVGRLPEIGEWVVEGVPGNHGMPQGRKAGAVTSTINYEFLWWQVLKADCVDLPLRFSEFATHGRCLFEVAGQPFVMTHGSEVRGQLGIPFYGIRTAWAKHQQELGQVIRYFVFGHIHQTSLTTYGDGAAMSSGDVPGYNQLTPRLRNPSSTPKQSVYFVSHEHGLAEVSYIDLERPAQRRQG